MYTYISLSLYIYIYIYRQHDRHSGRPGAAPEAAGPQEMYMYVCMYV